MLTKLNVINNEKVASTSGKLFQTHNPAHQSEVVASYPLSEPIDMLSAVDAAQTALPGWRATPIPARAAILRKAARLLVERVNPVSEHFTREEGKTLPEARMETLRAAEILEYFSGQGRYPIGEMYPAETPKNQLYSLREPVGIVGLITPWNFPIAIPTWKLAPALLYGNAVILKPASAAPGPACDLVECLLDAGLPAGVVNLVMGSGSSLGNVLLTDERINAVSFTGSEEVGTRLRTDNAGKKKLQMELGGKNPLVILADANLEKAVNAVIFGAFWSAGEKCTATSRLIVEKPVLEQVLEMLVKKIKELKVGDGLIDGIQICPLINRQAVNTVADICRAGETAGAELLVGGNILSEGEYADGCYFAPSLYHLPKPEGPLWTEELFGPVCAVVSADSPEQALALANDTRFGLVASVYTQSLPSAQEFIQGFHTGIVQINRATTGADVHVPFGGIKQSGSGGREQGLAAREFYTNLKTVYLEW